MLNRLVGLGGLIPMVVMAQGLSTQIDWNTQIKNKPLVGVVEFFWNRTNGSGASGDLASSGSGKVVTLTPGPRGITTSVPIRIYGGTGTAEVVYPTATTCSPTVVSSPNCTITLTTAQTHTGAWKVETGSAGMMEAWGGNSAIQLLPGNHAIYGTITPPANSTLMCGGRGRQYPGMTTITLSTNGIKAFNVVNRNFVITGCDVVGPGVGASSGSIGIYTAGGGSGIVGAEANDALIRDVRVTGFRDGIYIDGSGGSVDLERVEANNNTRYGLAGYGAQGYWKTVIAESNTSDGINLGLCVTVGSCGVGPFMSDIQTFNNGGWGIKALTSIFMSGNNYLNNDYEGEIYQLLPIGDSLDNGYIKNVTLQFSGETIDFGTNNDAPGILIDTDSGPLFIHNIRMFDVQGNGLYLKSGRHSISNITVVGAGQGGQSGHLYAMKTETATNLHIEDVVTNTPVSMTGADNISLLQSRIAVDSALPAFYMVSGTNAKLDQNFFSNATGHAIQTDSGVTLVDGDNEINGTRSFGHVPATLSRSNNTWRRILNGALPTLASASTITPTTPIAKVSGTAEIINIVVPAGFDGTELVLIPTDVWTMNGLQPGGNIALDVTAVVSKALTLYYNSTDGLWYPSY